MLSDRVQEFVDSAHTKGPLAEERLDAFARDPLLVHEVAAAARLTANEARLLSCVLSHQFNAMNGDFTAFGFNRHDVLEVSRQWLLRFGDTYAGLKRCADELSTPCMIHDACCRWLRLLIPDPFQRAEFDIAGSWLRRERKNLPTADAAENVPPAVRAGIAAICDALTALDCRPLPFEIRRVHAAGVTVEWRGTVRTLRSSVYGRALAEICRTGTTRPVRTEKPCTRDNIKNNEFMLSFFRISVENGRSYLVRKD